MRVELLVVADCPNEATTIENLRRALDESGRATTPIDVQIVTPETVHGLPLFAGSPTVLIDGVDPFADQATPDAALSCRIYRTHQGTTGAPSIEALHHAIGH